MTNNNTDIFESAQNASNRNIKRFFNNEDEKPRRYPEIYIAAKIGKHNQIEDIYFSIAHMLTCYYQWFFKQKDRSHRSLEIEANRWAEYICYSYLESKVS